MTKTDAGLWSRIAAETWAEDFSDALVCFSNDAVNKALYGFFATTKRADEEIGYGDICRAFLDLVDRNVLVPEFRSDLADEQMQSMRTKMAPKQTVPSESSASPTPSDPDDYSQMTQAQFDAFSTSDSKRLYRSNGSFRQRADYLWNVGGGL